MTVRRRHGQGFAAGSLIGSPDGSIGLGGAEFRLPVGIFERPTLQAVILNKAMSLAVVGSALAFRAKAVPVDQRLMRRFRPRTDWDDCRVYD
jgi:hypothetical protein